jgi:ectoine hydroxylase-related dioxygenase (phytanoyl-CoA dioxygenase family)
MCGVWVALEDISTENGPVFYYPGSQRLPEYNFSHIKTNVATPSYADYPQYEDFIQDILAVNHFEKKQFLAKKGDLLIWSSNIIHGGSPVNKEGATRWSQVTHYFFKDCFYYTPMLSNMVTSEYYLRSEIKDIKSKEKVSQTYNGEHIHVKRTAKNLFSLIAKSRIQLIIQKLLNKKNI